MNFGGVKALVDVDLEVRPGQLVGLIGPNGAGKTTFIDAASGFVQNQGRFWLDDKDISGSPPHVRARRGLARTWQASELFEDLTVEENLSVAHYRPSVLATLRDMVTAPRDTDPAIERALRLLGLEEIADTGADEISQAERKLVGVARGLVAEPRVLCLDEPAAGLDVVESQELGRRLREVVEAGTPILLVDHDMGLVLSICDHVVVLEFGKVIAQGSPAEVRKDPKVVEAYLGRAALEDDSINWS